MEKLKQHEIYINALYPVKFFLRIPKLDKMIKSLKKSSVKKNLLSALALIGTAQKISFPLRISSVNVTKSAVSFFVQCGAIH